MVTLGIKVTMSLVKCSSFNESIGFVCLKKLIVIENWGSFWCSENKYIFPFYFCITKVVSILEQRTHDIHSVGAWCMYIGPYFVYKIPLKQEIPSTLEYPNPIYTSTITKKHITS